MQWHWQVPLIKSSILEEGDVVDLQLQRTVDSRTPMANKYNVKYVRSMHTQELQNLGPYRHYMQKEIFEQARALWAIH